MLVASLLLHTVLLAAAFFLVRGEQKRIFLKPVYTTVEIVSSPAGKPAVKTKSTRKKKAHQKTAKKTVKVPARSPARTSKKAKKKVHKVGTKKAAAKAAPSRRAEEASISGALAAIEEKVRKREEDALVSSRIRAIEEKKRREEEELREKLEGIRKELLAGADTDTVSVEAGSTASSGGVTRELFELEYKEYYNTVGTMIRSAWIYPGEAEKGLRTTLSLRIGRDGELRGVSIEKGSGNALFDESALKAVKKASPFPPLPETMTEGDLELGVRFCPGGCD